MKATPSKKVKILDLLKKNPSGLTITQVSNSLKLNRITINHHLQRLIGEKKVIVRVVGKAKLLYHVEYVPEDLMKKLEKESEEEINNWMTV